VRFVLKLDDRRFAVPSFTALTRIARRFDRWPRLAGWWFSVLWDHSQPDAVLAAMLAVRVEHDVVLMRTYGLTWRQVSALPGPVEAALRAGAPLHLARWTRHEVDVLLAALGRGEQKAAAWRRLLAEIDPKFADTLGYDPVTAGVEFGRWRSIFRGVGNGN